MDVFPVTNRQYKEFIDDRKGHGVPYVKEEWAEAYNWDEKKRTYPEGMADHPVVLVSYNDAVEYCRWQSEKVGEEFRLPAEEEWEKAARGTDGREYPWGNNFDKGRCNTSESGIGKTTAVNNNPDGISPYKCYDMAGNVCEWTESWYDERQKEKVLRGGSWNGISFSARCAYRFRLNPDSRFNGVGFRCVRTLK
ncbi:MAG: formylglycine-generating enzyme family protein [bacterium]